MYNKYISHIKFLSCYPGTSTSIDLLIFEDSLTAIFINPKQIPEFKEKLKKFLKFWNYDNKLVLMCLLKFWKIEIIVE